MLRGPRDCHALRARNDVVIWWLVLLFGSGGHRGTAGAMPPALRARTNVGNGHDRSVVRSAMTTALRRNGTSHRPPPSLRAHRAWQSAPLRPLWGRAARCAAGVTDCHVASLLAMTWWFWLVLLIFAWRSSNAVGGGNAARPTVRIPYAERMLATGRAVLLDGKSARSIRLEFAPGQARYAERKLATSREGPMV